MNFKLLILVLLLSGCEVKTEYREVKIPVDRFVAVPAELTQPCNRPDINPETWGDLAELAQAALIVINKCDEQIKSIRNLK